MRRWCAWRESSCAWEPSCGQSLWTWRAGRPPSSPKQTTFDVGPDYVTVMSKDVPRITLAEASTEDQECQKSSLARDQLTTYLCRSCWLITLYYIHTYISNIVCPLSNLDISWENPGLDLLVHWIFVYQQIKGSVMEKPCALVSTFQARGYPWRCHAVVLQDKHQQLLCFVDCGSIWKKFVLDSSKNGFSCRGYLPCPICWKLLRPNDGSASHQ